MIREERYDELDENNPVLDIKDDKTEEIVNDGSILKCQWQKIWEHTCKFSVYSEIELHKTCSVEVLIWFQAKLDGHKGYYLKKE